ncbi:MAG: hypothetical protein IPH88_17020 [Bacteroidales bacterium]|nr:hypothetical protein [Bacteroidales bacterium]
MRNILAMVFLTLGMNVFSQISISTDASAPDNSAMLDVKSTTRGLLAPRMTLTQRNAIVLPATGLVIFQTTDIPGLYINTGTPALPEWGMVGVNSGQWLINSPDIYYSSGKVGINTSTPLASFHVAKNSPDFTALFGSDIQSYSDGTAVSIGDDAASPVLYLGQSASDKGYLIWNYNVNPVNAQFLIGTFNSSNPVLLQPYYGNVGVGVLAPLSKFHVSSSGSESLLGYTNTIPNYFYHTEDPVEGDGQSALFALRTRSYANHGYDYADFSSNSALKGMAYWGDEYSFGTSGFSYLDYERSGGVLGASSGGGYWGSLGYRATGYILYGGYFSNWNAGGGKSNQPNTGIGIGVWGNLMGADIHGKVYGIYAEGENYATYSNGLVIKNNLDVHLQENGTETQTVLYTNVSTDVTVTTSGYVTLSNGKASIAFDPAFTASVSADIPVVVTVTPVGSPNWVYLSEVSEKGFSIAEGNEGKSSAKVSFIAIGRRAGYEHPILPGEVIESSYTQNLARGLHNDAVKDTKGEGLYYEDGKLKVGIHPSVYTDRGKSAAETFIPAFSSVPASSGHNAAAGQPLGNDVHGTPNLQPQKAEKAIPTPAIVPESNSSGNTPAVNTSTSTQSQK